MLLQPAHRTEEQLIPPVSSEVPMLLPPLHVHAEVKVSCFCRLQASFHQFCFLQWNKFKFEKESRRWVSWRNSWTRDNVLPKESTNSLGKGGDERGCSCTRKGWGAKQDSVVYWEAEDLCESETRCQPAGKKVYLCKTAACRQTTRTDVSQ